MVNKIFFTPGPSELYPTVAKHYQSGLEDKIGAISHRSKQFQEIYANTTGRLKDLLQLPSGYHIFFLGSATEIWERIIENCVESSSFHCVNGSFSKRFYEFSKELGKSPLKAEAAFGKGFYPDDLQIPANIEAICLTHNETSSGVSMPVNDINKIRAVNPDPLIFVDSVSSLPFPDFDYNKIDSTFFSVQKCFGMPAGLGVWIVNEKCINKAVTLQEKGNLIGTYHTLPSLLEKGKVNQTPETPNVLEIYVLGKVVEDMLSKGIGTIRKETEAKAGLIYSYIKDSKTFSPSVEELKHRSATTIVANTAIPSSEINKALEKYDMQVGSGYSSYKDKQIRIANFPAHSLEAVDSLVNKLKELFG